jgi:ketosteroid isomerase-like protein
MKSILISLSLAAALTVGLMAADHSADQKAVLANVDKLLTAIEKGDTATIAPLLAEDLMYSHSNGKLESKAEALKAMATAKNKLYYSPAPTVTIHGNTATVRGMVTTASMADGKPITLKLNILQVWSKMDGKWILVARQATRLIPQ